jgi:hypothetical protein
MPLVTVNKFVACRVFPKEAVQEGNKKKLAVSGYGQKPSVIDLCVLWGNDENSEPRVTEDDSIWVKSTCVNAPWAKELFIFKTLDDQSVEFILVPTSEIVFVDRGAQAECRCDEVCSACRAMEAEMMAEDKAKAKVETEGKKEPEGEQVFPKVNPDKAN